jgi:hypothetical protein
VFDIKPAAGDIPDVDTVCLRGAAERRAIAGLQDLRLISEVSDGPGEEIDRAVTGQLIVGGR